MNKGVRKNSKESKSESKNCELSITIQLNTPAYHPIHHDTTASCAHRIHISTSTAVHNITAVVTKDGTLIHQKPGDVLNGTRYSNEKERAARACNMRTTNVMKKKRTSATQC